MTDNNELVERLRERLQIRYAGNCKCGHCQLVPAELLAAAADAIVSLIAEVEAANERTNAAIEDYNYARFWAAQQAYDGYTLKNY